MLLFKLIKWGGILAAFSAVTGVGFKHWDKIKQLVGIGTEEKSEGAETTTPTTQDATESGGSPGTPAAK